MTNQQGAPEALRLANALECRTTSWPDKVFAAAELRRLHAENERLQQELIRESRCTAEQKLRADQMTRQHADQAAMNREARAQLVALVDAQQPATHVQKPAGIEHVACNVSKNGPESNMAQQPAPSEQQPFGWIKQSEIDSSNDFGGSINLWRRKYDCDVPVYLAQQPATVQPVAQQGAATNDADAEEVDAVIACLGDDAATLREQNPECEMAANMDRAAELLALRTQQPAQSAAVALSDDLRDGLVAISAAIADQDDRAAQAMLREILAAPQPSTTPPADSHPAPVLLSDEELCQIEEPYLLNFRIPLGGQYDFARAVEKAVLAKTYWTQAPQPSPTPQADSQPALDRARIREIFIAHGFTVKEGQTDLKQYVYDAADALLRTARAPADSVTAPAGPSKSLPYEPTSAMLIAARERDPALPIETVRAIYWSMWRTAPTPPAQAADGVLEDAGGANWQDISTAPKDGTRFVAVGNNYGLYSETQHTCIAQWFRGCWIEASDWNETSELKYLTHWMPLLPLPGSAARAPEVVAAAPAGGVNWPQLRSALAMLMLGWGRNPNQTMDACYQVLDAATEPGKALAVLRTAPDWRDFMAASRAQAADSVLEDADRYRWLFGARTDAQAVSVSETVFKPLPQDEVLSHLQGFYMSKTVVDALVDAARKQGGAT